MGGPSSTTILIGAMFVSAGLVLWFGRGLTFSDDDMSLISLVADLEPGELFEPYVSHLVPISLVAGLLTYTVAAEFEGGVLVAALLERDWKRLWVAGVPLLAYAVWRLTLATASTEVEGTPPDFDNLLLLPAWALQSVGGALAALLGVGFDFLRLAPRDPTAAYGYLGPALALIFLFALGALVVAGRMEKSLLVVVMIALVLYASHNLAWATFGDRPWPGETRYLYPTTLVILMIGLEMARGIRWDRGRKAVSLVGAIGYLAIDGNRDGRGKIRQAEVLAVTLLESTDDPPPAERQPREGLRRSFEPADGAKFGYLGFTEQEVLSGARKWAPNIDRLLARAQRFGLRPLVGVVPVGCRPAPVVGGPRSRKVYLPRRGAILASPQPLEILLGRYGSRATVSLRPLGLDRAAILRLEPDDSATRGFVSSGPNSAGTLSGLVICRYEPARSASLSSLAPG